MSFGRAKAERAAAEKQREREEQRKLAEIEQRRQAWANRFDPIIRRLLDGIGKAEWGTGPFGQKKYKVDAWMEETWERGDWDDYTLRLSYRWEVRHTDARRSQDKYVEYQFYCLDLFYDDDGAAELLWVHRLERIRPGTDQDPERLIEEALTKCVREEGPHSEEREREHPRRSKSWSGPPLSARQRTGR